MHVQKVVYSFPHLIVQHNLVLTKKTTGVELNHNSSDVSFHVSLGKKMVRY